MKRMYKTYLGTLFMGIGLILVFSAAFLTGYNLWDENRAGNVVTEVMEEIDSFTEHIEDDDRIPEYTLNPEIDMPALILDRSRYIGVLEIPVLGLRLPVMDEWSYPNLKKSPCRYTGSAYLENMVIAAHNYKSHFGMLNQLQKGDQILFTDMDSNRFLYTVEETETLMPQEISHMITGDWDLTLFTCTLGGRTRFTVRCVAAEY